MLFTYLECSWHWTISLILTSIGRTQKSFVAPLWVWGTVPSIKRWLNGDGRAGWAANGQQVTVTGPLCVVLQHFGQVTWERKTINTVCLFSQLTLKRPNNEIWSVESCMLKPASHLGDWKRFTMFYNHWINPATLHLVMLHISKSWQIFACI